MAEDFSKSVLRGPEAHYSTRRVFFPVVIRRPPCRWSLHGESGGVRLFFLVIRDPARPLFPTRTWRYLWQRQSSLCLETSFPRTTTDPFFFVEVGSDSPIPLLPPINRVSPLLPAAASPKVVKKSLFHRMSLSLPISLASTRPDQHPLILAPPPVKMFGWSLFLS